MAPNERETRAMEMWSKISFEEKVEIDMAIGQGNKAEAVKRCMCAVREFDLLTANKAVEERAAQLTKRITLQKK